MCPVSFYASKRCVYSDSAGRPIAAPRLAELGGAPTRPVSGSASGARGLSSQTDTQDPVYRPASSAGGSIRRPSTSWSNQPPTRGSARPPTDRQSRLDPALTRELVHRER